MPARALQLMFAVVRILLPWLVEVFPRIPGTARFLAFFEGYEPMSDIDAMRALDRSMNWKPKKNPAFNDATSVIKVSDAIQCLQGGVNNSSHVWNVIKQGLIAIVGTPSNSAGPMADSVVQCLRENALRQDTPRRSIKSTRYGRPARGHGYGRSGF